MSVTNLHIVPVDDKTITLCGRNVDPDDDASDAEDEYVTMHARTLNAALLDGKYGGYILCFTCRKAAIERHSEAAI